MGSPNMQYELYRAYLENTKFKEVLKGAKRVCYISDSSGLRFENLAQEMEAQHPLLKSLLDEVRKGELDSRQEERDSISFRHSLLPIFADDMFPIFPRHRNPFEELWFFN